MPITTLVTGANGFLGSALVRRLSTEGDIKAVSAVRRSTWHPDTDAGSVVVGSIDGETDWHGALLHVDVVIHTAARAHVMKDHHASSESYRRINAQGSINLAMQAASHGVQRFNYISSLKVNGERTPFDHAFTADDLPLPQDPYAKSKLEAEETIKRICVEHGMEVVIVRPPLIYGPGVQANFQTMMRWLYRGIPLPFGAIHNLRSFIAIDNIIDFLAITVRCPAAANQVFLVSDGEDISTTQLLTVLGNALEKPARLFSLSRSLMRIGTAIIGNANIERLLFESLRADITKTKNLLNWKPPISVEEGIFRAANGFLIETRV